MTKLIVVTRSVLLLQSIAHAFNNAFVSITSDRPPIHQHQYNYATVIPTKQMRVVTAATTSPEEQQRQPSADSSPEAFMKYMAKSHEEKLRAVKDVEKKKNIEIQALKKELEEAKAVAASGINSSIVTTSNTDGQLSDSSSFEELSRKLLAYQTFMSNYIVSAQEEKYRAVLAAEEKVTRKYEDKLAAFLLEGTNDANGVSLPVERPIKGLVEPKSPPPTAKASTIVEDKLNIDVPPEVIAADHGLRADGGVGGLTLAQRVLQGVDTHSTVAADASDETDLEMDPIEKVYFKKNAKVAAAAKAGVHNRWGSAEEMLASEKGGPGNVDVVGPLILPPTPQSLPPSTELANGSIVDVTTPVSEVDPLRQLFYKRNARIATAADAGVHNRWILAEEKVAKDYMTNAEATPLYVVPPDVEEADHGMRADGGVGGPSLADRVNLGAQLLGA